MRIHHQAILALPLLVAACSGAPSSAPALTAAPAPKPVASVAPSGSTVDVDFGIIGEASFFLPLYAAQDRGWYAENGINLKLVPLQTTNLSSALASGSPPLAQPATDITLRAFAQGAKIKMIANFLETAPYALMSVKEVTRPDQLKGEKVAVSSLTSGSAVIARASLKNHGLLADRDYTLVAAGQNFERVAALENGSAKAGLFTDPATFELERRGYNVLASIAKELPHYSFTSLWVNEDWAKAHRKETVGFLRATIKATDWLYDPANEQQAEQIIATRFKLSPELAKRTYDYLTKEAKAWTPRLALTPTALDGLEKVGVELGLLTPDQAAPIDKVSDPSYYQEAIKGL
jgi:NitT/TauT family transport system substrate-binding protein